jgi:Kef-type K+ transport system membrane component KefB
MSTTAFLLILVCLLISVKVAGWIFHHLRFPVVIGQLLVGIIAGPSVSGWVHPNQMLDIFSNIGAILLLFIAGLETDMKQMREVGGAAFTAAVLLLCRWCCFCSDGWLFSLGLSFFRGIAYCDEC